MLPVDVSSDVVGCVEHGLNDRSSITISLRNESPRIPTK